MTSCLTEFEVKYLRELRLISEGLEHIARAITEAHKPPAPRIPADIHVRIGNPEAERSRIMEFNVEMTDRQKVAVGCTILDEDGQAYPSLPEGGTLTFESSNPAVADVVVRPDGLNADIGSGQVGTADITITPGGTLASFPVDVVHVNVKLSAPGSLNTSVGAPEAE